MFACNKSDGDRRQMSSTLELLGLLAFTAF
jgi:hypothetical protein